MSIISGIQNRAKVLTDRRYRHFYSQQRVKGLPARKAAADRMAAKLPRPSQVEGAEDTYRCLDTDGYAMLPNIISPQLIPDIQAYCADKMTFDGYRPQVEKFQGPGNAPKGTHVANFFHADVANTPHLLAIANNPVILSAVGSALGAKPTISSMSLWWSIAHGEQAKEAELFHRDIDDFRFIKLFVYLTDVDNDSGPHAFVKGTHKIDKLTDVRRLTDEEVAREFGAERILSFSGPAGTAFLENTYGIHRGVPPKSKNRLLFQVLYSLNEYIGGPKHPVAPYVPSQNGVSLDRYTNRVYLR